MAPWNSNKQIQLEVRESMARQPSVDADAIGISADHGLVCLSGHVLGVTQRRLAEEAALRVVGVRAVIDELRVRPGPGGCHDADLACVASDSLEQLIGLPYGRVKVVVRDGTVHLKGIVSRPDEREAIAARVRAAIGRNGSMDDSIALEEEICPRPVLASSSTSPSFFEGLVTPPSSGGSQIEDSLPETSTIIVTGRAFTGEGIPIRHAHHRGFPEIRGEGETSLQSVLMLAQRLTKAREHAREAWQRDGIDQAIREVGDYHANLLRNTLGEPVAVRPGDVQGQSVQVDLPLVTVGAV